jgi:hypothetical protein
MMNGRKALQPGWQKARMENFNTLVSGGFAPVDMVQDGWTDIIRNLLHIATQEGNKDLSPEKLSELAELADFKKMEQVRGRVDEIVKDPATAEALKPWYRQFCKRPCFHDDYLAAFNRENVTLVDTEGQGVDAITEHGVVVKGQGIQGRLPDLCDRLRSRHRLHPPGRLQSCRRAWRVSGRRPGGRACAACTACSCTDFRICS